MDYLQEFRHLREDSGLKFVKTAQQMRDAVEQRVQEIEESMHRRRALVIEFCEEHGIDLDYEGVFRTVCSYRDPSEIDANDYEPFSAFVIGHIASIVIESKTIDSLNFVRSHMSGDATLTYRSLSALFMPYDPYFTEREVGMPRVVRRVREVLSQRRKSKAKRRIVHEDEFSDNEPKGLSEFMRTPPI